MDATRFLRWRATDNAGKRRRALIGTLTVFVLVTTPGLAADRVVLYEEGTNWACGPSATVAPLIRQIMLDFGSRVAAVKYHVWWPDDNDPWYLHNPAPIRLRMSYYGISAIPDVCIDGRNGPAPHNSAAVVDWINGRLAIPSPIAIGGDGVIRGDDIEIHFDVDVEVAQAGSNYRLLVVCTEEDIPFNNPNGETHNYDVFRRENGWLGDPIGDPIDLSSTGVQHFDYILPYHSSYNRLGLHAVIWVQDATPPHGEDFEVVQAAEFWIRVPYHFTFAHASAPTQLGGASEVVSFAAEILNDGADPDVYDLSVEGVPAGWNYSYTTPMGTFSGPSTLPLDPSATAAISLDLDSRGNAGSAAVQMRAISQGDPQTAVSLEFTKLNGLDVLLVDDDGGETREVEYGASLSLAGVEWGLWDLNAWGALTDADLLNAAEAVVWATGATGGAGSLHPTFTAGDRDAIEGFVAGGGRLFVTGADIGYDLCDPASPRYSVEARTWFESSLHAFYTQDHVLSISLDGEPGDPISSGLVGVSIRHTPYPPGTPDGVLPEGGASTVWNFTNQAVDAGIRYDSGSSRLVYFSFCLINMEEPPRNEVMDRVIDWFGIAAGIPGQGEVPAVTPLLQNRPNPFSPETVIEYTLVEEGRVQLRVYDLSGRMVRELVNVVQAAKRHQIAWDGRDRNGQELDSGVYFYRLTAPGVRQTKRMVLAR